jgi:hypothetical protein
MEEYYTTDDDITTTLYYYGGTKQLPIFSLMILKVLKEKVHLLDLHFKTINILFYNYVFNSSQK